MVPRPVREELERADHLYVSAASAYEIAQKTRLGRLPLGVAIMARWQDIVAAMMADEIVLTAQEMARAGSMSWAHRDPFDRMLVAQALTRGLILVTRDGAIRAHEDVPCLTWE